MHAHIHIHIKMREDTGCSGGAPYRVQGSQRWHGTKTIHRQCPRWRLAGRRAGGADRQNNCFPRRSLFVYTCPYPSKQFTICLDKVKWDENYSHESHFELACAAEAMVIKPSDFDSSAFQIFDLLSHNHLFATQHVRKHQRGRYMCRHIDVFYSICHKFIVAQMICGSCAQCLGQSVSFSLHSE